MSAIQPLDNARHAGLRVALPNADNAGLAVNQMMVVSTEFEEAQRHYPILFRKDGEGALHALVILGFARDENLFLRSGAHGEIWDGYVPALVRRGPFMLGRGEGDDPLILINLDDPRVQQGGSAHGLPLFREHGGHAPALEASLQALRALHLGNLQARGMQALFEELGLIEEARIEVTLGEGTAINFAGYMVVTQERIDALDGAALERLSKAGLLLPAIFAASSLRNVNALVARSRAKGGAG